MQIIRLSKITATAVRFGLDEFVFAHRKLRFFKTLSSIIFFWRSLNTPRGERLRLALESLGPIFVKFGQVLSTRRDLLPDDISRELSYLQDQVPAFDFSVVSPILNKAYGGDYRSTFASFSEIAEASASVAQVHFGTLIDGREVAVKILRPGIHRIIKNDIALLNTAALLIEKLIPDGERLKPREIVGEFEKHLDDELDLLKEAANASQLGRNFPRSQMLEIPEVHWDFCTTNVMVMQRMFGTPINQLEKLRDKKINLEKLAADGVEIFFTQVFRDGFFHADMHPGNILVSDTGKYIALDFGIMGTLGDYDKQYLARNFIAFFRRNYRDVAQAHVDAGWVPSDTRVEEFEGAIRAVCEPIFDRPLKEISFGKLLLHLFQTARRFNVVIQPQLVLLQKTLLNVEGLGRDLDPDLDLWTTAKPFLEKWMSEQVGLRAFISNISVEIPTWSTMLPQIPRLVHAALSKDYENRYDGREIKLIAHKQKKIEKLTKLILGTLTIVVGILIYVILGGTVIPPFF